MNGSIGTRTPPRSSCTRSLARTRTVSVPDRESRCGSIAFTHEIGGPRLFYSCVDFHRVTHGDSRARDGHAVTRVREAGCGDDDDGHGDEERRSPPVTGARDQADAADVCRGFERDAARA